MAKKTERTEALHDDLKHFKALDALADSEGGSLIVKSLVKDVVANIEQIVANYGTMTHPEFISKSATIKTALDVARILTRAKANKKYVESELEKELSETES
jgi:hypothetical protein